jgi:hypothetical protein
VESEVAIVDVTQANMLGEWSTRIWLSKTKQGTFTCSAEEEVQEGGFPRDLPDKTGLRSGSDIYEAVAEFTDNYELWLEDSDWHGIAKALATFDPELESQFLAAWQERRKTN